jgi:hypothetical protein
MLSFLLPCNISLSPHYSIVPSKSRSAKHFLSSTHTSSRGTPARLNLVLSHLYSKLFAGSSAAVSAPELSQELCSRTWAPGSALKVFCPVCAMRTPVTYASMKSRSQRNSSSAHFIFMTCFAVPDQCGHSSNTSKSPSSKRGISTHCYTHSKNVTSSCNWSIRLLHQVSRNSHTSLSLSSVSLSLKRHHWSSRQRCSPSLPPSR